MLTRRNFLKSISMSALALSSLLGSLANNALALPRTRQELAAIEDKITKTGVAYGSIPSLNVHKYMNVNQARMSLADVDVVFVIAYPESPEEYYIIPQSIMVWHEVFNEVVKGNAYALTYSPVSGTLAFLNSRVRNMNLILDSYGSLYDNNSVLIDRNTGSYWVQMLGICYSGDLEGRSMTFLPVRWTNWKLAQHAYPDAKVLIKPPANNKRTYGRDPYGSFSGTNTYYQNEQILFPLEHYDTRMNAKTLIYAIEHEGALVAVDINYVREKKAVNFYLGPLALLALYDPTIDTIRVFNRRIWGSKDPAIFTLVNGIIEDFLTKSKWDTKGDCYEGNLDEIALEEIAGVYSFWFAFASINPETFTVPGDVVVPDSALEKGV